MAEKRSVRVLVVEDNAFVKRLAESVLLEQGHDVDVAEDGAAALSLLEARGREYELLILDMRLPRGSGEDVLAAVTRMLPDLPVIVSSGYPLDSALRVAGLLRKPYLSAELVELVERVLGDRCAA